MTDVEATRAAYLIGDLYFRLGDLQEATRWLSRCVETPEGRAQAGILRMARDRLTEGRELIRGGSGRVAVSATRRLARGLRRVRQVRCRPRERAHAGAV